MWFLFGDESDINTCMWENRYRMEKRIVVNEKMSRNDNLKGKKEELEEMKGDMRDGRSYKGWEGIQRIWRIRGDEIDTCTRGWEGMECGRSEKDQVKVDILLILTCSKNDKDLLIALASVSLLPIVCAGIYTVKCYNYTV